jgi:GH24 family phage-related lysozyme (muramidase)
MTTSRDGRRFIIAHEAVRGISNRLHWPGGVSGVTLGPGYDMGTRTQSSVVSDLTAIGVERSTAVAVAVAAGAGWKGHDAKVFVKKNKNLVTIYIRQESALLDQIVPHYESMVKDSIRIPLHQYEFDALVSYAYNPGGGWKSTTALVNEHKPSAAMEVIARYIKSGPDVVASLVVRRKAESRLFLYGEYK